MSYKTNLGPTLNFQQVREIGLAQYHIYNCGMLCGQIKLLLQSTLELPISYIRGTVSESWSYHMLTMKILAVLQKQDITSHCHKLTVSQ